ncbi:MAG TPA: nuclear transport factor 2 family protein, partial [Ilumatobacteraceae bacterium]|nr:nuclear transport factor 2 family protein [Ilumatobacteraceae bacterium]
MNTSVLSPTDIARRLYAAREVGDMATVAGLVTDDVVLHVPGTHPLAGAHRGLAAFAEFAAATTALTDDGEDIEVIDVLGGTDHAAVYCHVTARRAGRPPLDNLTVHLLRIRDGRVAEAWLHNFDDV